MIKRFAGSARVAASALLINAALAGLVSAADAAPAPVEVNPDHPTVYTVQQGDTLWGISEKFLKNPWQWPEVWHINEQVANPHLIYPGDKLRLVWKDGQPSLVVDRGEDTATSTAGIGSANTIAEVMADGSTVKLRPRMRELPLSAAIPAIPLKNIETFLVDSRVVSIEELKKAPYIVAGADKRVMVGSGDTAYARTQLNDWEQAFPEYGIYRQGGSYVDPVTKELLGHEARRIGIVRLTDSNKDIATLRVLSASEDLRVDDKLLTTDQRKVQSMFYPRPAPDDVSGQVIHIFGSIGYGARNDVVAINRGSREKIETGHVFAVLQKGESVRDRSRGDIVDLPPVEAGLLVVFRVFEKVSYALVVKSTRPIVAKDLVRAPRIDAQ